MSEKPSAHMVCQLPGEMQVRKEYLPGPEIVVIVVFKMVGILGKVISEADSNTPFLYTPFQDLIR